MLTIGCVYAAITTYQADDFTQYVIVEDDYGVPVDITGSAVEFYARLNQSDAAPIFDLTVGDGIEITNGPAGMFTISASAEEMGFDSLEYPYEDDRISPTYWITLTPAGGKKITILSGPLTVFRS